MRIGSPLAADTCQFVSDPAHNMVFSQGRSACAAKISQMSHTRAVSLMVLVTFLWSIAGVVTRHLDSAGGFEVTFWRSAFNAAALAVGLSILRGPTLWRTVLRSPWPVWFSGICWSVMFTAFMLALTLTTVANVLVTMAIGPLLTALFARIFLGHRLALRTWAAIAAGGLGIGWMFGQEARSAMSWSGTLVALAVPMAAALNFTMLQFVAQRRPRMGQTGQQDMLPAVLIGALLSSAVTLPLAFPFQASPRDLVLLAVLGVFQLAIPCLLVVRLSRVLAAAEISLLNLLEVVFGVSWAWLGAGERPSAGTLIGGALVLGALLANEALAIVSATRRRQAAASAAGRRHGAAGVPTVHGAAKD